MFLTLKLIYQGYQDFTENNRDVRIEHYPLMGSPLKILALTAVYLLVVKKLGPHFMRNRRPYNVKNAMLVYNALQVVVNAVFCYLGTVLLLTVPTYRDWGCMTFDREKDVLGVRYAYLYFILKVVDYMDTVFMVLRKNFRQITFLHVYHHVLMALGTYAGARFLGGGHLLMMGYLNCFVHVVMYGYYFASALRPELKSAIWWKKHITHLQLLQFALLMVHFIRPLLRKKCDQPKALILFAVIQNGVMIVLFLKFYYKAYCVAHTTKTQTLATGTITPKAKSP